MRNYKQNKHFVHIILLILSILYNSKFILMATSLETNIVIVTRVHCTNIVSIGSSTSQCNTYTKNTRWNKAKAKWLSEPRTYEKKVKEKSRECHNHKPQPFPDTKRKRKPINPNKHKSNKRTKNIKISSLLPKRGNRNAKRTEKHKNKMTQGKT